MAPSRDVDVDRHRAAARHWIAAQLDDAPVRPLSLTDKRLVVVERLETVIGLELRVARTEFTGLGLRNEKFPGRCAESHQSRIDAHHVGKALVPGYEAYVLVVYRHATIDIGDDGRQQSRLALELGRVRFGLGDIPHEHQQGTILEGAKPGLDPAAG